MKKLIVFTLILLITLTITACNGNGIPADSGALTPSNSIASPESQPTALPEAPESTENTEVDLSNDLSSIMGLAYFAMKYDPNEPDEVIKDGIGMNVSTWMDGNIETSVTIWLDGEYIITTTRIEGESRYSTDQDYLRGMWSYENYILKLDNGFEFTLDPATNEFNKNES